MFLFTSQVQGFTKIYPA